jgi:hypothetical protein
VDRGGERREERGGRETRKRDEEGFREKRERRGEEEQRNQLDEGKGRRKVAVTNRLIL